MKKRNLLAVLVVVSLVSACSTQRHYVNGSSTQGTRVVQENHDFFVSGLGQTKTVNAAEACGGAANVVATETKSSPLNIVLSILTWGIYTPREHTVYCN